MAKKVVSKKRFFLKFSFGHWSVMDSNDLKMVAAYPKKEDADKTCAGLNRLRKIESIDNMKNYLKSTKGYGHYTGK
jgi:uncharacterized protein YjlB